METTPQTVRIMLDEPPPPTQVVALTEGDEAVAEAFGEVQKLEENLSKLNEQLKELDDKLAAGEDDAQASIDTCKVERAELEKLLDTQRRKADMVGAKEVSEVLKVQSLQSMDSFTHELRLASDVLIRHRPLPLGHRHRRAKHQHADDEAQQLFSEGGLGGADGGGGSSLYEAQQSSGMLMTPRSSSMSPRTPGSRHTHRSGSCSPRTPLSSSHCGAYSQHLGLGAGGGGGGGPAAMSAPHMGTPLGEGLGNHAMSSSSSVGLGATAANNSFSRYETSSIIFGSPGGGDDGSGDGRHGHLNSPRGRQGFSPSAPLTARGSSRGFSPRSHGEFSPRASAITPRHSPGHSPPMGGQPTLTPLGSRASLHSQTSSVVSAVPSKPDAFDIAAMVEAGIIGGINRARPPATAGGSPRPSLLTTRFGTGSLTREMFERAQAAYQLEVANRPIPRHSQLSRVPKPSLLRRCPEINATPGVPFTWHRGPPVAVGPISGLFARSPRLDEPLDYDPTDPIPPRSARRKMAEEAAEEEANAADTPAATRRSSVAGSRPTSVAGSTRPKTAASAASGAK